jgi:hypothetical protein
MGHPPQNVTPKDFARVTVGHVRAGSVAKHDDAQRVRAGLVLGREDAIDGAEKRTHSELSAGYTCKIDATPGEYLGERYDQAQTTIRYNHVAMLAPGAGRMGRECRLDAAGEEILEVQETDTMKIVINGKTYENEAEAQKAIAALEGRADAAEAQAKTLTELVAKYDAAAAMARHDALVAKVRSVMGADFPVTRKDANGVEAPLSDRELRVAVIRRADASFDEKERTDVYIEARFDSTLSTSSKAREVIDALNGRPLAVRKDESEDPNGPRARVAAKVEAAKKAGVAVIG